MVIGLLGLLLLSSDSTTAAPPTAPTQATAPTAKAVKEKKICKVDDADSGSHMVRRVCLTAEEWTQRGQGMMKSSRAGFSGTAEDH